MIGGIIWYGHQGSIYLKRILRGDLRVFVADCIREIALWYEFEIDTMGVGEAHGLIILKFPPRYSITDVV
jgi:REP element-mobilizing transposase RayT